jgi:hypothetical protein
MDPVAAIERRLPIRKTKTRSIEKKKRKKRKSKESFRFQPHATSFGSHRSTINVQVFGNTKHEYTKMTRDNSTGQTHLDIPDRPCMNTRIPVVPACRSSQNPCRHNLSPS